MSQNMRRFRPDGPAVAGGRIAGYPWNGYPNALNAAKAHLGGNPFRLREATARQAGAASFLAFGRVAAEG